MDYLCFLLWFQFRAGVILLFYIEIKFRFQLRRETTPWAWQLLNSVLPYIHIWVSAGTNSMAATCTHLRLIHLIDIFLGKVQRNDFLYTISLCRVCQFYTSILKAHLITTPISILPSGSGHIEIAHIKVNPKPFKLNSLLNSTITNTLFSGTLLAWWKKRVHQWKFMKKNLTFITKDEDESDLAWRPQCYISKYAEHFTSAACGFRLCCLCFNAQFEVEEETEGSVTTPTLSAGFANFSWD